MKLCNEVSSRWNFQMPHRLAEKMQFCEFAKNAGLLSKTKQASRGLSGIAELFCFFCVHF